MEAIATCMDEVARCSRCSAKEILISSIECSAEVSKALVAAVEIKGPFASGERIFHANQTPRAIYVVREGAIKCERGSANGSVHVAGFYLSGELLACEDIGAKQHSYDAIALEKSWVCEISLDKLNLLFASYPELHQAVLRYLSKRVRNSERMLTNSFHLRAKQRLMSFLCELYARLSQRKRQRGCAIPLPMCKIDIANHLGISPETLSRLLRELEHDKLIRNGGKDIELFDPESLLCQFTH